MQASPRISLIVPVYGVAQYLPKFLESVDAQGFKDYEIVFIDDGSRDGSSSILDSYVETNPHCEIIHKPNGGVSRARNVGIRLAEGEYFYFVDSDDWLEPTALESLWLCACNTKADIVIGDYITEASKDSVLCRIGCGEFCTSSIETIHALQAAVNSSGCLRVQRPEFDGIRAFGGPPWRCMIRSGLIRDNGLLFDPDVNGIGDDVLFLLHVYEHATSVAYTPEVIYHYRRLRVSYTQGFREDYLEHNAVFFEKETDFIAHYGKGDLFIQSFYMRVVIYLNQGVKRYFLNGSNPETDSKRYASFVQTLQIAPYCEAIRSLSLKLTSDRKIQVSVWMFRHGLLRLYWLASSLYLKAIG